MSNPRKWQRREYEQVALAAVGKTRTMVLFWARQCRKSTTLGSIGFREMLEYPGRRVIAASASLLVGSEIVSKTISASEQAALAAREAAAMQAAMLNGASESDGVQVVAADSKTGQTYDALSPDAFTELYKTARLEMRMYHSKTLYSRLQVIAPNPATARGWTGTVLQVESGFVPQFAELQEAVSPIIDADKDFRMIYASNLPRDDRHPFFEMTLPPVDAQFPASPKGHFYRGPSGILIHRVSLGDAYAAGHVLYDSNKGLPLTLEEHFARAVDKGAWRRNYGLIHEFGGTAAIDFLALDSSQRRGIGECLLAYIDKDEDFYRALEHLEKHIGSGETGIGVDVATTTGETSNPTSCAVTVRRGLHLSQVVNFVWKERKPQIARERFGKILDVIKARKDGGRARRFVIDASNERYFAEETADILRNEVPVELVMGGASVQPPGYEQPINYKTWLGDMYSAQVNDNRYSLPPEAYLKKDHRMVVKDRGAYSCTPSADGMHGDTFDGGKYAQYAIMGAGQSFAQSVASRPPQSDRIGGTNTKIIAPI